MIELNIDVKVDDHSSKSRQIKDVWIDKNYFKKVLEENEFGSTYTTKEALKAKGQKQSVLKNH